MDRINPTKVFIDQNNIPRMGKFRHFYSVKGFEKHFDHFDVFVIYKMLRIFGTRKELLGLGRVSY